MNKELKKMNFKVAFFSLIFVTAAAVANDTVVDSTSVESRQKSLLEKLSDFEANSLGFAINGSAKAGYLHSALDAEEAVSGTTLSEASAYTQMNLTFSVRPSAETVAKFDLRFHKDWQNAHREGNNSPITMWWSYDGDIMQKHVSFNLGHMRVAYTPFTVYQPLADFIYEPSIFQERRKNVMKDKNLDGSNNRLMQGINATFTSGKVGMFDDIFAHGTMARLRAMAKKGDQVFFDFDRSDRYLYAGNIGAQWKGFTLGINDAYTFNPVRSSRSASIIASDTLYYDYNNVLSVELGYDSKNNISNVFHFAVKAEYALSNWSYYRDYIKSHVEKEIVVVNDTTIVDGVINTLDAGYLAYRNKTINNPATEKITSLDNKGALNINLLADAKMNNLEMNADANVLMVDKGFQAELAMTPTAISNMPILNSAVEFNNASLAPLMSNIRSGSLENLYFTLYESVPMNSSNILVKDPSVYESEFYRLYNNFKYAQYYRNGFHNFALTRSELLSTSNVLDPTSDIALPFGLATPNRTGGNMDLSAKWKEAISAKIVFGYYFADEILNTEENSFISGSEYLRIGGGFKIEFERLVNLPKDLGLQLGGSYEMTNEKGYLERSVSRMMVGFDASYKNWSLLTGFQMFDRDFEKPYFGVINNTSEKLAMAGVRYKFSAGAYATLQYGYMINAVDYLDLLSGAVKTLEINKNILMADVTVNF